MTRLERARAPLRMALAAGMVGIGVLHFVLPEPFMRIVPPSFGDARLLVLVSGAFEVLGGVGLLLPQTRRAAAWGLILLYVAVFPANIYMALEGIQIFPEHPAPEWAAWLRLPFQAVFIAWAYLFTQPEPAAVQAGSGAPPESA
ncbi:MAG: hypothetical protein R3B40_31010 [Polyangiales bacterium]|nr:DoxX family protein [Myxococcales bacterium]MCB9657350.1 hypothetical protein [Sandaracinaceae bacterium]